MITTDDTGTLVNVKRVPRSDRRVESLRLEAEVLRALRHPLAPRLLGVEESDTELVVVTHRLPGTALHERPPADLDTFVAVLARLATGLDDLHRGGRTHGNLRPDHVIVDGDGRPALCSWGRSNVAENPAAVRADLDALRRTGMEVLGRVPTPRRSDRRRRLALAHTLAAPAASGAALADGLRHPAGATRPPVFAVVTVVGILLGVLGTGWWASRGRPATADTPTTPVADLAGEASTTTAPDSTVPDPTVPDPTVPDSTVPVTASTVPAGSADTGSGGPWVADTDGDGLPESVESAVDPDGTPVAVIGGRRHRLEGASAFTVGDWDGDGRSTVAVLTAAGRVQVFDAWGDGIVARTIGLATGATGLRTGLGADGRVAPIAVDAAGTPVGLR